MAERQARNHSSHPYSPTKSAAPTEGTAENVEREQDGLIQEQKERTSDEPPTIIPFRSEEVQAAAARPDPQETHDTQGDAGHASAEQRLWVSLARRMVAKRKRAKRWDWSKFINLHEKSAEERLERAKARYHREKLLSGKHTQLPAPSAMIIQFPSEQTQAADGSDDPPGDA